MGDTLTINIIVNLEDFKNIRERDFNLCMARDVQYGEVEEQGNVVFSVVPAKNVSQVMSLKWEDVDKYQVYETSRFQPGVV
ncbi:hypothetical protein BYT27DRAFT_7198762, partial [Phlegmacium glaucopus]